MALLSAVLVLLLTVYIGYQITENLTQTIKTTDAVLFTVDEVIYSRGVFIRSQRQVSGNYDDIPEFVVQDGEKVAAGQKLAGYFYDDDTYYAYRDSLEVSEQIESLRQAYSSLSAGADSVKLDGLIYDDLLEVSSTVKKGDISDLSSVYSDLNRLIITRISGTMTTEEYDKQMQTLEGLKSYYDSKLAGADWVLSEAAGYFLSGSDGYERHFDYDSVKKLTADDIENAEDDPRPLPGNIIGTVVDEYYWYFAIVLTPEQGDMLEGRTSVKLRFTDLDDEEMDLQVYSFTPQDDGRVVLILRSGIMDKALLKARFEDVEIVVDAYTGIKVPREALRQKDGKWGVYCLMGSQATFKEVQWIYQTDSYYLVTPSEDSRSGLAVYDQIIISGKGLDENKVLK